MKVIGYWSYDPKDTDAVTDKILKSNEIRNKEPNRFPKIIFDPHFLTGGPRGFTIFEVDNDDQLAELVMYFYPVLNWEFISIMRARATLYQKSKK